jgi:hypothetical protein
MARLRRRRRPAPVIRKSNVGNYRESPPSPGPAFCCLSASAPVAERYLAIKRSTTETRIADVRLEWTRSRSIRLVSVNREIPSSLAISVNASQKASSRLTLVDVPLVRVKVCFRGFIGFPRLAIAIDPLSARKAELRPSAPTSLHRSHFTPAFWLPIADLNCHETGGRRHARVMQPAPPAALFEF